MATTPLRPVDAVDLARMLVRERDRAARIAGEHTDLPQLSAMYAGQERAYDLVLAYVTGYVGLANADTLELLIRPGTPATPAAEPAPAAADLSASLGGR